MSCLWAERGFVLALAWGGGVVGDGRAAGRHPRSDHVVEQNWFGVVARPGVFWPVVVGIVGSVVTSAAARVFTAALSSAAGSREPVLSGLKR